MTNSPTCKKGLQGLISLLALFFNLRFPFLSSIIATSTLQKVYNDTRFICKKFTRTFVEAEIAIGDRADRIVVIPSMSITSDNANVPFTLLRRQFSVQPAFGMNINKWQCQTLSFNAICLLIPVSTNSQFYVALSRGCDSADIKISLLNELPLSTLADNVVFNEVITKTQN